LTNTKVTDAEVVEQRDPVIIRPHAINEGTVNGVNFLEATGRSARLKLGLRSSLAFSATGGYIPRTALKELVLERRDVIMLSSGMSTDEVKQAVPRC